MEVLNKFEMQIKAVSKNEAFARSTVAAFCVELNPTLEQLSDIKTAVSEAVTNCIVHGYNYAPNGIIYLEVCLYSGKVEIIISDKGEGIDNLEKAMQPFFTTKPEQERSGMGFTLMQTFMDEVKVESKSGEGTKVFMVKNFGKEE